MTVLLDLLVGNIAVINNQQFYSRMLQLLLYCNRLYTACQVFDPVAGTNDDGDIGHAITSCVCIQMLWKRYSKFFQLLDYICLLYL